MCILQSETVQAVVPREEVVNCGQEIEVQVEGHIALSQEGVGQREAMDQIADVVIRPQFGAGDSLGQAEMDDVEIELAEGVVEGARTAVVGHEEEERESVGQRHRQNV